MVEETTYLQEGDLLVTSTRIVINGQTFAVRNIGSVRVDQSGVGLLPVLCFAVGVFLLGMPDKTIALMIILGTVAWIYQKISLRKLILVTGGGEVTALSTSKKDLVSRLQSAIVSAISTR